MPTAGIVEDLAQFMLDFPKFRMEFDGANKALDLTITNHAEMFASGRKVILTYKPIKQDQDVPEVIPDYEMFVLAVKIEVNRDLRQPVVRVIPNNPKPFFGDTLVALEWATETWRAVVTPRGDSKNLVRKQVDIRFK